MAKRKTVFVLIDGDGSATPTSEETHIRAICGVYTTLNKAQFRAEEKHAKSLGLEVGVMRAQLSADKTKWRTENVFDMDDGQPPRKLSKLRHAGGGEPYVLYTVVEMVLQ